ncbi:protein kinase domain-containing protein [Candidatus Uabimicrobium amorphum]|uniref:Serine/threonine protein kinase n=1 Tax=Uabimicrobium amorphum TaxID=2596890 RepID=A0A5S9ILY9_UABAM|nr:protein kinase [Candidatus Uabimicrobium amorphum]BBM84319.1 serine/threonine protein kinase [Candidatus Uabimicrobium amorphum]
MEFRKIGELALLRRWLNSTDIDIILQLQKRQRLAGKTEVATLFGRLCIEQAVLDEAQVNTLLAEQRLHGAKKLSRYVIAAEIGRGGMGCVYRAFDEKLKREVAIKVILGENDSPQLQRFYCEAEAIASLNHENIVTLHDYGHEVGIHYLVMELLPGETLSKWVLKANPSPRQAVEYVLQILHAIEYAHRKGIIHRDLKPQNVIVTGNKCKVLDFGLAKSVERESFSVSGTLAGTPTYMAPEQAHNFKNANEQSDVYSLGAILYFCLCQKPPFSGDFIHIVQALRQGKRPQPLREVNAKVSRSLEHIVAIAMHRDINKRYKSVAMFHEALQNYLAGQYRFFVPRISRKGKLFIAVAVTLMVILFTMYWKITAPHREFVQKCRAVAKGEVSPLIHNHYDKLSPTQRELYQGALMELLQTPGTSRETIKLQVMSFLITKKVTKVAPLLVKIIRGSDSSEMRRAAIKGLGTLQIKKHADVFVDVIHNEDNDLWLRMEAMTALGMWKIEKYLPMFLGIIEKHREESLRQHAITSIHLYDLDTYMNRLQKVMHHDANRYVRVKIIELFASKKNKQLIPEIMQRLKNDDTPEVRNAAVVALVTLDSRRNLPVLLKDANLPIKIAAIRALGNVTAKDDLPNLRSFLRDATICNELIRSLEKLKLRGYADAIVQTLSQNQSFVTQICVVDFLTNLQIRQYFTQIDELLRKDNAPEVKTKILRMIANLELQEYKESVYQVLRDELPSVQVFAATTLGKLRAKAREMQAIYNNSSNTILRGTIANAIAMTESKLNLEALLRTSSEKWINTILQFATSLDLSKKQWQEFWESYQNANFPAYRKFCKNYRIK